MQAGDLTKTDNISTGKLMLIYKVFQQTYNISTGKLMLMYEVFQQTEAKFKTISIKVIILDYNY